MMEHSARATAMAGRSASGARGYLSVRAGRPCRRLLAKAREDAGHEADVVKFVVDSGAAMTRREAISMVSAAALSSSAIASLLRASPSVAAEPGILQTRRNELQSVLETLQGDPKDELAIAEKNLLNAQIKAYEANAEFVSKTRGLVTSGKQNFLQHAVLEVKDLDKAVKFWTQGLGMRVNRSRGSGPGRQAFVSYGPETLVAENGGNFALELVENPNTQVDNSGQYFQFALSNSLRVNRLYNSGGEITFGYGYFEIVAPDGYKVVVYIENRRDPFDLIGVPVDDVEATASYYERVFGMTADRKYGSVSVGRFEPARTPGSVLMTYGDPADNTSILLVPRVQGSKAEPPASVKIAVLDQDVFQRRDNLIQGGLQPKFVGEVPGTGGTKVALAVPRQGVPLVFVDYEDFEREQPQPTVLSIAEEIQQYVAMAKDDEN